MRETVFVLGLVWSAAACSPDGAEPAASRKSASEATTAAGHPPAAAPAQQPSSAASDPSSDQGYPAPPRRTLRDGTALFGSTPFQSAVPFVELTALLAKPEAHLGTRLRTVGSVERVCVKRGCWLELAASEGPSLRVPMAGHAFAIPQRAVGQRVEVQGTLRSRQMPPAMREHLAGEGARTLGPLALEASAVRLPVPQARSESR